ncbi:porin family protein [Chondrinema litorale]|uniref:porin family protein n=1 Tax=Chondrinema litorale TaxID=2994555 RepID=UPI002542B58F|nr:porin family protein [Chondrinema litorale]UZR97371.1 porin family protein [Chondrinema litorale]
MLKNIFTILLLLIIGNSCYAQRNSAGQIFSYFKKGVGISFLSPINANDSGVRAGFHLGFAPSFPLGENTILKPELAFSMKGGKAGYNPSNLGVFDGDITYKINYLELPVAVGYKIGRLFQIEAGAYGALPVGTSFDFDGQFVAGYGSFDKDDIHDFDYGLIGGIKIGPLGIRYYHGLTTVAATDISEVFLGDASQYTVQIYFQRSKNRGF